MQPGLLLGALLANLLERFPEARLIVVGEQHTDANSFSLLRLGVKGLLTYVEARDQLIRALPLVAAGGFWVPRSVLSGFVDSILTGQGRRLKTDAVTNLSRREQEVLDSLLENLSNKEIAEQAEHRRTHREVPRVEPVEQIWCAAPRRPASC